MKRVFASLLAIMAIAVAPATALASSCPDGFHAHEVGNGDREHEGHHHVGRGLDAVDRNGNGVICVKHLTKEIHLHLDDLDL